MGSGTTGTACSTELLVIARQLGCLTGWDIEPLLAVSTAKLDPAVEMNLATEPEAERLAVHERLARLARDAKLRRRYERLLRTVWVEAEPTLREVGRPARSSRRPARAGIDGAWTVAARAHRQRPHRPAAEVRAPDRAGVA